MAEPEKVNPSLEVSIHGLSAKGEAYEDIRPSVQTAVEIADAFLKVAKSLIRIPSLYLRTKLEPFEKRLLEQLEKIPEEKRVPPQHRIEFAIEKELEGAAEEPEIQRLFADLLASSCNADLQDQTHPAFARVISELVPLDAKILTHFASRRFIDFPRPVDVMGLRMIHGNSPSTKRAFETSLDNLIRLRLIEFRESETMPRLRSNPLRAQSPWDVGTLFLTTFGNQFVRTCLPRNSVKEVSEEPE